VLIAILIASKKTDKKQDSNYKLILGIIVTCLGIFLLITFFIGPYLHSFITDPFFWAFISMFALIGASSSLITRQLGRYPKLNMSLVGVFALGRIMLVLPLCCQPRFNFGNLQFFVGTALIFSGIAFLTSLIYINPWPAPSEKTILVTDGNYRLVRNPVYLGEILWSLGLAVIFGSIIGIALIPLWWAGLLFLVVLEEEDLERKLGKSYRKYKHNVRGRILPGLPI
jgi:protein-S-isoprenylcysteine O-methyltransferase Ste14